MNSVKDLQKAADLERQKAEDERREAQKHRDAAKGFSLDDDPQLPMNEQQEAQNADARAQQHDEAANKLVEEASTVQAQAIAAEQKKQDRQVQLQSEIDQLDTQVKTLRGE